MLSGSLVDVARMSEGSNKASDRIGWRVVRAEKR